MIPEPSYVKAKTVWVWTDKAEKLNPQHSRSGQVIWPHYAEQAPKKWLEEELIIDSGDYSKDGQADLFEFL